MNIEEIIKFIHELKSQVPKNGSDYTNGYHFALMMVEQLCNGNNPFELKIGGLEITTNKD